ncbi:hypothetical protein [Glutamicibacter sp.]|nr:hypothetical protein [Glutamicibacter sp.]
MREKLAEPMRLGEVMAEYLIELEATCRNYQATVQDGGFSVGGEQ